jgi:hypothetical protein
VNPDPVLNLKVKRAETQILNDHSIRVSVFLSVKEQHNSNLLCKMLVTSSEELFIITALKY